MWGTSHPRVSTSVTTATLSCLGLECEQTEEGRRGSGGFLSLSPLPPLRSELGVFFLSILSSLRITVFVLSVLALVIYTGFQIALSSIWGMVQEKQGFYHWFGSILSFGLHVQIFCYNLSFSIFQQVFFFFFQIGFFLLVCFYSSIINFAVFLQFLLYSKVTQSHTAPLLIHSKCKTCFMHSVSVSDLRSLGERGWSGLTPFYLKQELPWTCILLINSWGPCMNQGFSSKDFMVLFIFSCSLHYNDTTKSLLKFIMVVLV